MKNINSNVYRMFITFLILLQILGFFIKKKKKKTLLIYYINNLLILFKVCLLSILNIESLLVNHSIVLKRTFLILCKEE